MSAIRLLDYYILLVTQCEWTIKNIWDVAFCQRCLKKNFSPFCFASPEIIGVKVCDRRTDRQILLHHIRGYLYFFFQLNFLPPYSLSSQGDQSWNNVRPWAIVNIFDVESFRSNGIQWEFIIIKSSETDVPKNNELTQKIWFNFHSSNCLRAGALLKKLISLQKILKIEAGPNKILLRGGISCFNEG